jgi:O-methyltransferase involved in polyketide biosynthesis
MTAEPQIACSLSDEELPQRLAEMAAIGRDALLAVSPEGVLHFHADAATRERLEAVIAAESACCSFLGFDLVEDAGELVLTVTAPEGAEPLASELIGAFAGDSRAAT